MAYPRQEDIRFVEVLQTTSQSERTCLLDAIDVLLVGFLEKLGIFVEYLVSLHAPLLQLKYVNKTPNMTP